MMHPDIQEIELVEALSIAIPDDASRCNYFLTRKNRHPILSLQSRAKSPNDADKISLPEATGTGEKRDHS